MTKKTVENMRILGSMAGSGASAAEIAAVIGVTPSCVHVWAKWAGVKLPSRQEMQHRVLLRPEYREKRMAAVQAAQRANAANRKRLERAPIPKWVPRDLREEFIDAARLYGEEQASSIIRRMKAEAGASA